jgi:CDP-diacylglycerol--glycerol-3-phosphate 3-phosphatidyltransferase
MKGFQQNFPNWLTYIRVAIIPLVVVTFYFPGDFGKLLTSSLFLIASVTDWFDGYLARKWNVQSEIGRFLDPIADKLLVATCLLLLVGKPTSNIIMIPAIAIICREILVSGLREFLAEIQVKVHVTTLAKYKTAIQMVAVYLLLLSTAGPTFLPVDLLGQVLLWASAALTIYTGYAYMKTGWEYMSCKK